jgi:anti-sigma B factor antagonist
MTIESSAAATAPTAAGIRVVAIRGDLDMTSITEFKTGVAEHLASAAEIILDLSGLRFCDSSGLGALVLLSRKALAAGCVLRLARPRPAVAHLIELSGIGHVLPVHSDLASAGATTAAEFYELDLSYQ